VGSLPLHEGRELRGGPTELLLVHLQVPRQPGGGGWGMRDGGGSTRARRRGVKATSNIVKYRKSCGEQVTIIRSTLFAYSLRETRGDMLVGTGRDNYIQGFA